MLYSTFCLIKKNVTDIVRGEKNPEVLLKFKKN